MCVCVCVCVCVCACEREREKGRERKDTPKFFHACFINVQPAYLWLSVRIFL